MADDAPRALPDRRQLARLPGLLRPARVDRDQRRAADQRDLRARLDAGQNHRRAPPAAGSSSPGTPGMSGREVTYDLYKAQRKPRPDLLREQWPHLMPLVEAFGYTNVKVEGYEADDVIASLARQAREEGIAVMVVTGDRDAYQLVGDGIRVMSTSRGITETKIYDSDAVHRALRRAAGADHRPDGPARRHLRQHPRRPRDRRENRDPAAAEVRLAGGGAGQRRRDLRRQTQAEPGRARRRRPHVEGAGDAAVRHRDRGRPGRRRWTPSPTAAPCATSCASSSCGRCWSGSKKRCPRATRCPAAASRPSWRSRPSEGTPADLGEGPAALAIDGDRWAAAEASASSPALEPRRAGRGAGRAARRPRRKSLGGGRHGLLAAAAREGVELGSTTTRCSPPTCWSCRKSLGGGRHGLLAAAAREGVELDLDHDTMVAAYLLEPQRRTYELTELAADAGIGLAEGAAAATATRTTASCRSARRSRRASTRPRRRAWSPPSPTSSARASRSSACEPLLREVELPLVEVLAAMEREGLKLDAERLAEVGAGFGERIDDAGEGDLRAGRGGVHDRLAAAGRPHPLREARA